MFDFRIDNVNASTICLGIFFCDIESFWKFEFFGKTFFGNSNVTERMYFRRKRFFENIIVFGNTAVTHNPSTTRIRE